MSDLRAPRSFETTRWSLVRLAAGGDDTAARAALSGLCEAYWYPVYAFIRRSGHSPHDAEDLTQGFFADILERRAFASADPSRGRLRSFLLACLCHYLRDEHVRATAQKRGAHLLTSFDGTWAEDRYGHEPADHLTPDRLYQRRWAVTVLEHSLQLLSEEFAALGKAKLFETLRPFLGFDSGPEPSCEAAAAVLAMPEGTVRSHLHRLRIRWREMLFEQVAMTLEEPSAEAIKAELSELLDAV
jgi:RNA polymerase sigma-70 factor (ECF subfamily)